jgi:hypothetical protein
VLNAALQSITELFKLPVEFFEWLGGPLVSQLADP